MFDVLAFFLIALILTVTAPLWAIGMVIYLWFLFFIQAFGSVRNWIAANF